MARTSKNIRVYSLGIGCATDRNGEPIHSWPYMVDYAPGHEGGEFCLSEGDARNGNGSFFHATALLEPSWRGHLETAGVLWLLPLLERMVAGAGLSESEILEAYRQVHGTPPTSQEWTLYC
ncbi:MAG: hypothetical protein H7Z41_06610 [Cytophagales bacterium]|nr:hypothetical protein [Armatimonadota bacterium]